MPLVDFDDFILPAGCQGMFKMPATFAAGGQQVNPAPAQPRSHFPSHDR